METQSNTESLARIYLTSGTAVPHMWKKSEFANISQYGLIFLRN